VVAP